MGATGIKLWRIDVAQDGSPGDANVSPGSGEEFDTSRVIALLSHRICDTDVSRSLILSLAD